MSGNIDLMKPILPSICLGPFRGMPNVFQGLFK